MIDRNIIKKAGKIIALTSTILAASSGKELLAKEVNIEAEEITVYATRSARSTFDVPSIVSQIDANSPGNNLANDVSQLLEFTPGVDVQNGPRRNGQNVTIRGFDDEAVITLIDGRRQNYESAHDGRFFIDPNLLKKIEIAKGASSAIYGGGAVGGVVAFETKDAADFLEKGKKYGTTTSFGYRSANNEYSPSITSYAVENDWDLVANISHRNTDNIRLGNKEKLQEENEMISGLFKAGYTLNDFHEFKAQGKFQNNSAFEPNNGAGEIDNSNPIVEKKIKDQQFSLKYSYNNPDNKLLNPKFHIYNNNSIVEEQDLTGNNRGRLQTRQINTTGLTLDNQSKFLLNNNHKHTLSYGFEIYADRQNGKRSGQDQRPGVPNAESLNHGFYIQDEIALNTDIGEFLAIPAARFDSYESNDNVGNSQDAQRLSPKFSLTYKPNKKLMVFGNWARAFRAPNLTELYSAGQHFPGVFIPGFGQIIPNNNFVANPDLKPETVDTIEFGGGINLKNIFAKNDKLNFKGSWFQSEGSNFITQEINVGRGTTANLNIERAVLIGFEAEAKYQFGNFQAKIGGNYTEAENEITGEYLPNNVPLTAISDFSYKFQPISSIFGVRAKFVDANSKVGSEDIENSGFSVFDFYYRFQPESSKLSNLTIDLGIDNIFNKRYQNRFATLYQEGRNFGTKVTYKW
jgi:hemoglobin/transferrin/lactoferrin receptor protein